MQSPPMDLRNPMVPVPVAIRRVSRETRETVTLRLDVPTRPPGSPSDDGFAFRPGQFNMLYLFGVGEVAISISGDPRRTDEVVHTVRAVGTVTTPMARLERGGVVGLRGPFGSGWPIEESVGGDLVLVAGGLGLAPLRPVVYHVLRHRARYRRVAVLFGARSPEELLYRREIERWRRRDDLDVHVTVDHASADWKGDVGVVPALLSRARIDPASTVAMLCGPEVMMRYAVRELEHLGVGRERIYLSLERNMKCAFGVCGHCQLGPVFVCKDGPILRLDRIDFLFGRREI